ncbi:MAG: hypothetical protein O3B16_03295 [Chloroflexi bacterium]|nr:hypothetical protein [Chloroflexota bacterium]
MDSWLRKFGAVRGKRALLAGLLLLCFSSQVVVTGVAAASADSLLIAAAGTATATPTPTPLAASGRALCRQVRQNNGRLRVVCSFPKPPGSIVATRLAPNPVVKLTLVPVRTRVP